MNLFMVYNELPPSSNHIYFRGTILTKQAREYAERFSYHIVRNYLPEINGLSTDCIFAIHMRFFFNKLETDTWKYATQEQRDLGFINKITTVTIDGKKHRERKDVRILRYKRVDLDNMVKLLQDCVRDAIGVDDSLIFAASQEKHQSPGNERVEILLQPITDRTQFGLSP